LKGLYFEKIALGSMFGFNIYHDGESFRKRMLFHKDEKVVDEWIKRLQFTAATTTSRSSMTRKT